MEINAVMGGPGRKNEFELVTEAPDDALTLLIGKSGDKLVGAVHCPASATGGRLPKDYSSGEMPGQEAFRSAIKLANDLKVPIVIMDPHDAWPKEWGTLYVTE